MFWVRWLSLFSLDAVLVALAWQEVLARASAVHLTWQERALLGISVWSVYILDHLLDGAIGARLEIANKAPRHCFVRRHRFFFICALVAGLLIDVSLLPYLSFSLLIAGSALALITLFYLILNTSLLAHGMWPKGKEIAISLIFTLGCGLVPLVQTSHHAILFFSMMALLLLNNINCTLIARLERGVTLETLSTDLIPAPRLVVPAALFLLLITHLDSSF